MKTFFRSILLGVMLCCVSTTFAVDYSGYYRFVGPRTGCLATDNGTIMTLTSGTSATTGNLNEIWNIRANGDSYIIVNAGTGRLLVSPTATRTSYPTSADAFTPFYIKTSGSKYIISSSALFTGNSCLHEDGSRRVVIWNETESNSKWTLTAVTGTELQRAQTAMSSYEATISTLIDRYNRTKVLNEGGAFRLKSRYDRYAYETTSTHAIASTATKTANSLNQIWVIEKKGSSHTIRNAETGRYLPNSGGNDTALQTVESPTNYYIKLSDYSTDYFTISWSDNYSGTSCLHENRQHNVVKWYANNAANANQYSDWTLEPVEAADTEATAEKLREHIGQISGIATTIVSGTYRMIPAAYPTRALSEDVDNMGVTTELRNERYSQVWRLNVSADGTTCTMQNVLTEHYAKNNGTTSVQFKMQTTGTSNVNFTIGRGGSQYDCLFNFRGSNNGFHCASSQSYMVVGWSETDAGSQWILYPVEIDEDALAAERAEIETSTEMSNNAAAYNDKLQKYFADYACTALRSTYANTTADALRKAMAADGLPEVLQNMGVSILTQTWESGKSTTYNNYIRKFRIQDVQCYSDNNVWAEITKTGAFGELTSPTGIQGSAGDYVYIFVDEEPDEDATLRALLAYDTEYRNKGALVLHKGLNVWRLPCDGEVVLNYFNANAERRLDEFPLIRTHIEGGSVNGCWDFSRNMTNADWTWLKTNMFKGKFLHIKGLNTVLNVLADNVRSATQPVEIMKGWDYAFLGLQEAIGHTGQWEGRYNPVVNPRHSYSGNPNWGGYGGSNHPSITSSYLFNYDNFYKNNIWEILHEIGHGCQGPIKMAGTTEVTNNSLAQIVSHKMGNLYSRGNGTDRLVQLFNYERDGKHGWSWVDYVRYATPFYDASLHTGNHLLYQLYLYFEVMGHSPGFLTRLMNEMRANPITYSGKDKVNTTPVTYNDDFWKFARACATASQTDLWEFFEAYGFWKYTDEIISSSTDDPTVGSTAWEAGNRFIGDYGNYSMKLPVHGNATDERNRQELRAYMSSMPHQGANILFIDDHVRTETVSPTSFVATINASRSGQPKAEYWDVPRVDYGDYRDYDGQNHTQNISYTIGSVVTQNYTTDKGGEWNYSITGTQIRMSGEGILGVKIYDSEGQLCYLANTQTFVIPTPMAEGLRKGTYSLHVAATASLDIVMGKDGQPVAALMGDVNGDGAINVGDLTALVAFILGSNTTGYSFDAADMNHDGQVNVTDYTLLVNTILTSK